MILGISTVMLIASLASPSFADAQTPIETLSNLDLIHEYQKISAKRLEIYEGNGELSGCSFSEVFFGSCLAKKDKQLLEREDAAKEEIQSRIVRAGARLNELTLDILPRLVVNTNKQDEQQFTGILLKAMNGEAVDFQCFLPMYQDQSDDSSNVLVQCMGENVNYQAWYTPHR
jgi:hypothetical protein